RDARGARGSLVCFASLGLPGPSVLVSLGGSHDGAAGARSPVVQSFGRTRAKTSAALGERAAASVRVSLPCDPHHQATPRAPPRLVAPSAMTRASPSPRRALDSRRPPGTP